MRLAYMITWQRYVITYHQSHVNFNYILEIFFFYIQSHMSLRQFTYDSNTITCDWAIFTCALFYIFTCETWYVIIYLLLISIYLHNHMRLNKGSHVRAIPIACDFTWYVRDAKKKFILFFRYHILITYDFDSNHMWLKHKSHVKICMQSHIIIVCDHIPTVCDHIPIRMW